jgi:hypothetical protein
MGALTDAGAGLLLDSALGANHGTLWPATIYLALSTTDPAITMTEPSGGSYARKSVANNATNFAAATSRQKTNLLSLAFATATGAWGVVTHVAVMDAATGGTMLAHDQLPVSASVISGDTLTIPVGGLVLSC